MCRLLWDKANGVLLAVPLFIFISTTLQKGNASESRLLEPVSIENGSEIVILDCPYEDDHNDEGLVIKWFSTDDTTDMIYQWIPPDSPKERGILDGRVNTSYSISDNDYSRYRALAITNPTTDLTGKYECFVSGFNRSDERMVVFLTVYSPPSDFSVKYEEFDDKSITVSCFAEELYPEPVLELYMGTNQHYKKLISSEGETNYELDDSNNTFSAYVEKNIQDTHLDYENIFTCALTFNQTKYRLENETIYYSDTTTTTFITAAPTIITTPFTPNNVEDKPESSGNYCKSCLLLQISSLILVLVSMSSISQS